MSLWKEGDIFRSTLLVLYFILTHHKPNSLELLNIDYAMIILSLYFPSPSETLVGSPVAPNTFLNPGSLARASFPDEPSHRPIFETPHHPTLLLVLARSLTDAGSLSNPPDISTTLPSRLMTKKLYKGEKGARKSRQSLNQSEPHSLI